MRSWRLNRHAPTALAGVLALMAGCESDLNPVIETDLVVRGRFIEFSREPGGSLEQGLVPKVDGTAGNLEWGSADDPERPYSYVLLSSDNGFGGSAGFSFIAVKAAYTAEWNPVAEQWILGNIYFLFQWADNSPSQYKDSMIYTGPDLSVLQPQFAAYYQQFVDIKPPVEPDSLTAAQAEQAVTNELVNVIFDENGALRPQQWRQDGKDDRLMVFLGDGEAEDGQGRAFKFFGTQMLRDGAGFGPVARGFVDVWEWSATRTNPHHEIFDINDTGGDVDPIQGFCGYADDLYIDSVDPLTRDDGPGLWLRNFDPSLPPQERIPLRAWNPSSDPNFNDPGNSACTQINMGMSFPWLQRGSVRGAFIRPSPSDPKIRNRIVFKWDTKQTEQSRLWEPLDFVSGYLIGHDYYDRTDPVDFTLCFRGCPLPIEEGDPSNCDDQPYDSGSHRVNTLQTRAKGLYQNRTWVLEVARPLRTVWGTEDANPRQDFNIDRVLDEPIDFYVSLALWNDADDGGPYVGSPAIRVHLDPPPPRGGKR